MTTATTDIPTTVLPALVLRSPDANWNYARWEQLPDDGNRHICLRASAAAAGRGSIRRRAGHDALA